MPWQLMREECCNVSRSRMKFRCISSQVSRCQWSSIVLTANLVWVSRTTPLLVSLQKYATLSTATLTLRKLRRCNFCRCWKRWDRKTQWLDLRISLTATCVNAMTSILTIPRSRRYWFRLHWWRETTSSIMMWYSLTLRTIQINLV